jgi:uncharacterized membrane protein YbhN (UPF0104 family)
MGKESSEERLSPAIIRAPILRLVLYEVTEAELEQLGEGSPVAIHLNLAIFSISIAFSFLVSILSTKLDDKIYIWFVIVTVVAGFAGLFLFVFWIRKRKSVTELIRTIKKRLPSEGIQQVSQEVSSVE